jgi:OOP family OmpA-OmpF porin
MTRLNAIGLIGLAGLGSIAAAPAIAQDDKYWYGGLSLGQSRSKIDEERITASLLAAGLTTTAMSRDESDPAFKLFGGYQFNRNFALEAGYFNLGKFGFTSTTSPAGTLNGQIKLQGLNLDLVGTLPITQKLSAIARVGGQYANARDTFSGTGAVSVMNANPRKSEFNYKVGAGLQYAFSPSFILRGEGERYRINDAVGNHGDINVVSVSLVFPFGRAPEVRPRAAAPVYVAPPEPAAPAPVVAAAAPVAAVVVAPERRRVSFSADSLFAFDQSVVRPEGKKALDAFAQELKGTRFDVITVEGHTDRLGSVAYNQKLSTRRAESVKDYLVNAGGVDAGKVSAVGKSESDPVTKADDCRGSAQNAKLIACLQPDRRVVVEVAGTR